MTTATPLRPNQHLFGHHSPPSKTDAPATQRSVNSVRELPIWKKAGQNEDRAEKSVKTLGDFVKPISDHARQTQRPHETSKLLMKTASRITADSVAKANSSVANMVSAFARSTPIVSRSLGNTTNGIGPQQPYTQDDRPMAVMTPLGKDQLLLIGLSGAEELSRLFRFSLDLLALNGTPVQFEKLLGREVSIRLNAADGTPRYISGICSRFSQAERDATFTTYRMEVVPKLWLLTNNVQSRIFQQISVPEILKRVFKEIDFTSEIQGTFEKRDYCVQYRESDFDFASRLMEEEGIYYFFRHTADGHKLVLSNTPHSHTDLPIASQLTYETIDGGRRSEDRVYAWEKVQELRASKVTLWDHCFELPHKHLEAGRGIQDSVKVGKTMHPLKLPTNSNLEQYNYPGEYAQRFDGVNPSGGKRSEDLQKIFQDNQRTARVRMEQEAVPGLVVQGESNCRQLVSGHRFTFARHFDADGAYVLTTVTHSAMLDDYRSEATGSFQYSNQFTCIPFDLPYRPQQTTQKPTIQGTQTAVVVGPPGEEIWPDQYSRVKVQFHWDREGKNDLNSSCWVRVSTPWAGKQWGMIHIPRIGQEVIVAFEEGDPDRPIIVGSVYNYEQMPPFPLPANKMQSGIKSNTHKGQGYNEIVFDDTAGKEQIRMHGQYNMDTVVNNNQTQVVGVDRQAKVGNNESTEVGVNQINSVGVNRATKVGTDESLQVGANLAEKVGANRSREVGANETVQIAANQAVTIGANQNISAGQNIVITAGTSITLKCGAASIHMNQAGVITISGTLVSMLAAINANVAAPITNVSGAMLLTQTGTVNLSAGVINRMDAAATAVVNSGGSAAMTAGGDAIVQGALVKLN